MDDRYIGVFDSGLGGLTVLKELIKQLPGERYIFLADSARSPYGDKSVEDLYKIVYSNIEFLMAQGVKMIVFACNTVSTLDLDYLRDKYRIPIVTVLEATIDGLTKDDNTILVTATEAAIKSEKHKSLINQALPGAKVILQACGELAPAIESGGLSYDQAQNVVDKYILEYSNIDVDVCVLGCTHYPIWKDHFINRLGGAKVLDPAYWTALRVRKALESLDIKRLSEDGEPRQDKYFVNGDKKMFKEKIKKIFSINPIFLEEI